MFIEGATELHKTIFSLQMQLLPGLHSPQVPVVMAWTCENSGMGPDGASWPQETWKPQDIFMTPIQRCMHMPRPAWVARWHWDLGQSLDFMQTGLGELLSIAQLF